MAGLNLPREIRYRPCIVHGEKCIFHRWATNQYVIIKFDDNVPLEQRMYFNDTFRATKVVPPNCIAEVVSNVYGVVEYEDGTIKPIEAYDITFLDSAGLFQEYDWGEK